jgi:hypothetical protein
MTIATAFQFNYFPYLLERYFGKLEIKVSVIVESNCILSEKGYERLIRGSALSLNRHLPE